MNLSGLGAVSGGFQQAQAQQQQLQLKAQQIQQAQMQIDQAKKQLQTEAMAGQILSRLGGQGAPGASPQPPMPGQPSQPMQQSGQGGPPPGMMPPGGQRPPMAPGPQQGAPGPQMPGAAPGGPPMQGAPPQQQGGGQPQGQPPPMPQGGYTIQQLVQIAKQAGVQDADLPAALERAQSVLAPQDRMRFEMWKEQDARRRTDIQDDKSKITEKRYADLAQESNDRLALADRVSRMKEIRDARLDEIRSKHYNNEDERNTDVAATNKQYREGVLALDNKRLGIEEGKILSTERDRSFKNQVSALNTQIKELQSKQRINQGAQMGTGKTDPVDQAKIDRLTAERDGILKDWQKTGASKDDIVKALKAPDEAPAAKPDAAPAGKYKPGDVIDGPDGKKYRVTGGDPNDPDVEPIQ